MTVARTTTSGKALQAAKNLITKGQFALNKADEIGWISKHDFHPNVDFPTSGRFKSAFDEAGFAFREAAEQIDIGAAHLGDDVVGKPAGLGRAIHTLTNDAWRLGQAESDAFLAHRTDVRRWKWPNDEHLEAAKQHIDASLKML